MRSIITLCCLLLSSYISIAQLSLHNRQWLIGTPQYPIDFSTSPPQVGGIPPSPIPGYYSLHNGSADTRSIAVSNDSGELIFFMSHKSVIFASSVLENLKPKLYDKNGYAFPNGNITLLNLNGQSGAPLVVPYPLQKDKYIIFYESNRGFYYSVVDMTLNNGWGDIDPHQKDILLSPTGSVTGIKTVSIPACESRVWVVIRSAIENAYYSFLVDENGVNPTKVVSEVGNFEHKAYYISPAPVSGGNPGGLLTASHQGKYIVAATGKGTEIYEFEKCSGILKNTQILDSVFSIGVVFSPDDSKLYASTYIPAFEGHDLTQNSLPTYFSIGEIYQFDMNQPTLEAIRNSKTLVMRNPVYRHLGFTDWEDDTSPFHQMKIGLDGKIYVAKNIKKHYSNMCHVYVPYPGSEPFPPLPFNECLREQYLHVIHQPNQLGVACQPELNYLKISETHGEKLHIWLQNDIKPASNLPIDTLWNSKEEEVVCFSLEHILSVPKWAECLVWEDGSTDVERTVYESGTYWAEYYNGCTYQRDSFEVTFVPLPQVNSHYYGCENQITFEIQTPLDFEYEYSLYNEWGNLAAQSSGASGVSYLSLKSGLYTLNISAMGCDTTLEIELISYPDTELVVRPEDTTIYYGDAIELSAAGAVHYLWSPANSLDTITKSNPLATPEEDTWYTVYFIDQYGCTDSAGLMVRVDYSMPFFIPNAFSPNGDGVNDEFRIEGLTHQKILQLAIFNRYGQEVFHTLNPNQGWDGSYLGKPCDMGVYFYQLELAKPNGEHYVLNGEIHLIR